MSIHCKQGGDKCMASINDIVQVITQVGFPIVMCLIMFKYVQDLNDIHKQETDKLTESINNLSVLVNRLLEKFDIIEKYIGNSNGQTNK